MSEVALIQRCRGYVWWRWKVFEVEVEVRVQRVGEVVVELEECDEVRLTNRTKMSRHEMTEH